jgi:glycosyltransferase involved in cell wall biosynthesis
VGTEPLVTIALPVFNGAESVGAVAKSVLAQDYENIEFLISDNASTDGTEELCRELADSDARVRYHRQPRNIGLINNFEWTKHHCRGVFLRWIGDSDEIRPTFVSRCVELFVDDPRLFLVTTQLEYITNHGETMSMYYDGGALRSDDAVVRLRAILDLLPISYLLIDPLYGMTRVDIARRSSHDQILRGDEVYAARLALAGPWAHVPEILGTRRWTDPSASQIASLLEVPHWQVPVRGIIAARRMLDAIDGTHLSPADTRRAKAIVGRFYVRRRWAAMKRRGRRIRTELGLS